MITELFMDFVFALAHYTLAILPNGAPPSWLAETASTVATVWGYGYSLGAWFPWAAIGVVVPAVLLSNVAGFTVKLCRQVLSIFTAGGGSAG